MPEVSLDLLLDSHEVSGSFINFIEAKQLSRWSVQWLIAIISARCLCDYILIIIHDVMLDVIHQKDYFRGYFLVDFTINPLEAPKMEGMKSFLFWRRFGGFGF